MGGAWPRFQSDLTMTHSTRRAARPSNTRPPLRKGLGQHLLVSDGVLEAVVKAVDLTGAETVVEIGPGTGLLTKKLLRDARRVVAVEIDPAMVALLRSELADAQNLTLIEGDALTQDPAYLVGGEPYFVVANLPYNVATPTIRLFLESSHRPTRMVVMVQREVAKEMTAMPGQLGLLGLAVQIYAKVRIVRRVRPGSFLPPPKVESAVVRLDPYPEPLVPSGRIAQFFKVARAGFSAPRKQLRNSMAQGIGLPPGQVEQWLDKTHIDPRRRAETLSLDEWLSLLETAPADINK